MKPFQNAFVYSSTQANETIPSTNDGVTHQDVDDQTLSQNTANNTNAHKDIHEQISEQIVVQVHTLSPFHFEDPIEID